VRVIENGVEFSNSIVLPNDAQLTDRRKLIDSLRERGEADYAISTLEDNIDKAWLISMARLHAGKGQDHLMRVWAELPAEARAKCLLVLAGPETLDGELARLQSIAATVPDSQSIVFPGRIPEPVPWLLASDIFLSGSEYEGMPLAPIEACGAGLAVILSNIEGHRLLADAARFFDLDSPKDGARHIMDALKERSLEPRSYFQRRIVVAERMRALHGIGKMAKTYLDLYNESLG
jgi:glycosyltransferase involved in cell wall biosynthesis